MPNVLLPAVHGAVEFAVYGKIRPSVRVTPGEGLVDIDAEAGFVARMHHAVSEGISVWEDAIRFVGMPHIFLDSEVVNAQIEMQHGRHADGAHVRGAVRA